MLKTNMYIWYYLIYELSQFLDLMEINVLDFL